MNAKQMQYKGPSRDVVYNPWFRLVRGQVYNVEKHEMKSGKVRARVSDEDHETVRLMYGNRREFDREWCR